MQLRYRQGLPLQQRCLHLAWRARAPAGHMGLKIGQNKYSGVKKDGGGRIIQSQQMTEGSLPPLPLERAQS